MADILDTFVNTFQFRSHLIEQQIRPAAQIRASRDILHCVINLPTPLIGDNHLECVLKTTPTIRFAH